MQKNSISKRGMIIVKKALKIVLILLAIIIVLGIICYAVDYNRVKEQKLPIFCIPMTIYSDGGTMEYWGLGYKVIDFNRLYTDETPDWEKEANSKICIGSFFMDYHDAYQKARQGITIEIKNVQFTRTYQVIADLDRTNESGTDQYYVVAQFQQEEPILIKVNKEYSLEENKNYEFTFEGSITVGENKKRDNATIFQEFAIKNIVETDKVGLDQIQEEPN